MKEYEPTRRELDALFAKLGLKRIAHEFDILVIDDDKYDEYVAEHCFRSDDVTVMKSEEESESGE